VLSICLISEGTDLNVMIPPKQITQGAILQNAFGVILAHNHPSGDATPSNEDKFATSRVSQCLKLFDIKLIDHIIVTSDSYFSMADKNLIN